MTILHRQPFDDNFSISPHLNRLLTLQTLASTAINNLTTDTIAQLRLYYNHALVSRRTVVADVTSETWIFDLASSLAATLFARERIISTQFSDLQVQQACTQLIHVLRTDITQPWFQFVLRNARRPTMIAMPSLPALQLGISEERFYVQSVSDSWPTKQVSTLEGNVININSRASRRFVDGMVAGDLGNVELVVTEHEKSFVQNHSIGWITRYETATRQVTIIEIDPWSTAELSLDEKARRLAHGIVKVKEQQLNDFRLDMKLHEADSFADNLILSRILAIDQTRSPMHWQTDSFNIEEYIHVSGSPRDGLGPVDEEVLLKSLGSITAKNKFRSALAISAKARLRALQTHGRFIRNIMWKENVKLKSMMVRCGVDGIYVKTRIPFDSVFVFITAIILSGTGFYVLISKAGVENIGESASLALALTLGVGFTYHNLRYKSWPIGETVRLRRMCASDEEMSICMSQHEMISTLAEAGSKGAGMDGILTCPFSDSDAGKFSVTRPLELEMGSKVGLKLRISTALEPLWVDLKGVRDVEEKGMWHAYGPYKEKTYLELTRTGPSIIGGDDTTSS